MDAQENDSGNLAAAANDEITKILIFAQNQPRLSVCQAENLSVADATSNFCNVKRIVAISAPRSDNSRVDAFVRQPKHGTQR